MNAAQMKFRIELFERTIVKRFLSIHISYLCFSFTLFNVLIHLNLDCLLCIIHFTKLCVGNWKLWIRVVFLYLFASADFTCYCDVGQVGTRHVFRKLDQRANLLLHVQPDFAFKTKQKKLFQCLANLLKSDILSSNPSAIQSAGDDTSQWVSKVLKSLESRYQHEEKVLTLFKKSQVVSVEICCFRHSRPPLLCMLQFQ